MRARALALLASLSAVSGTQMFETGPAHGASLRLAVQIAVRSVTVTVVNSSADDCSVIGVTGGVDLLLPTSGSCTVPSTALVIANGAVPDHIDVVGHAAVPSDQGVGWTLCGGAGPACTGRLGRPGKNQYEVSLTAMNKGTKRLVVSPPLTTSPRCNTAFAPAQVDPCLAGSGQRASEGAVIVGPSSSTDRSRLFSAPIGWLAVP